MKKYLLVAAAFALTIFSTAYAADVKIGIVDIKKVIHESKAGKSARALFQKEFEGKRQQIASREEFIAKLEKSYKENISKYSAKERAEKEEQLKKEAKELRRVKDDFAEELKKKENELTIRLLRDIHGIVKKISDEGKYTVILETGSVVYFTDAINITSKVIDRLKK